MIKASTASILKAQVLNRQEPPAALIGVHNALVSRLAWKAGFDGGWVSSFEISAVLGLPDRNIVGIAETVSVTRSMAIATDLPLLVDIDNGYGCNKGVARAVRELGWVGAAGVCIEDNTFPKSNSFLDKRRHTLENKRDFARRIEHAVASRVDPDFLVVARTEALIAGLGMDAAFERARCYADAGADVILIHSRDSSGTEAIETAERWTGSTPLMAIPTAFPQLSLKELGSMGYRLVVYANHLLRASVWNMETVLASIRRGEMQDLDDRIVSMKYMLELSEKF